MKNKKTKIKQMSNLSRKLSRRKLSPQDKQPTLRFSPTAWAKLLYFRDKTDNEIGGFGITGPDDLLFIKEFITVKQEVTPVSVKFDDEAVADFFDTQVDLGRKPEQFARHWIHCHPGDFAEPSAIDEDTFKRVFGSCNWAVMFILDENNKAYTRLSFNVGPGGQILIPVEVEYSHDFGPSDKQAWDIEFKNNIKAVKWVSDSGDKEDELFENDFSSPVLSKDVISELERMDPEEREHVLNELADRPDLWNEEMEDIYV